MRWRRFRRDYIHWGETNQNYAGGVRPEDLAGCETQHEGLVRYAQLSDGLVKVQEAAPIFRLAKLSNAKDTSTTYSSLTATLDRSLDFERAPDDSGLFRYKKFARHSFHTTGQAATPSEGSLP